MNVTPREFRKLWPEFEAPSWAAWGSVEDAIFGEEPKDPELVRKVTGRDELPSEQVSEAWIIAGRGAGKSRFVARVAVYFAAGREHERVAGEFIYCGVFAPDRKQAGVTFRYVVGLLKEVPALERLIVRERAQSVELSTGVVIEVVTANKAAPRGRAYALALIEEAAFLPQGDSAEPDTELLRALRPALARVPASLLAVVSSPYARRGELWKTHRKHFGRDDSAAVLVIQAPTRTLNPSFSELEIERAYAEDPEAAAAEYGANFRRDVAAFISPEVLAAVTIPGRTELPPVPGTRYMAFTDVSGAGADSFALAVGHVEDREDTTVKVVDCLREIRPPLDIDDAVREFAETLKSYAVSRVVGDHYAGEWPPQAFSKAGVDYSQADRPKGALYREMLATLNTASIELPESRRLLAQLASLERRTARGGRDVIDHPPGPRCHDDLANAVAGLSYELDTERRQGEHGLLFCGSGDIDDELEELEREFGGGKWARR